VFYRVFYRVFFVHAAFVRIKLMMMMVMMMMMMMMINNTTGPDLAGGTPGPS